jgi:hypothetical protein
MTSVKLIIVETIFLLIPILLIIAIFKGKIIMTKFQKTTSVVGLALMVGLMLILIVRTFSAKKNKDENWPPVIGECPDFWTNEVGSKTGCVNVHNLGKCSKKTVDFSTPEFSGSDGLCNKYTWANNCGVSWDGITYGVKNPCLKNDDASK